MKYHGAKHDEAYEYEIKSTAPVSVRDRIICDWCGKEQAVKFVSIGRVQSHHGSFDYLCQSCLDDALNIHAERLQRQA